MQYGAVFPQIETPPDPKAIRDYTQAVEGMGYNYLLAYDHVLGANPDRPGGWRGPYTYDNPFHEPFVTFAYMAAITENLGFATGILILPQRQTALVAKQAAQLDMLSGGRLRLGVGIGWNKVEYDGLGMDFHNRGKRSAEQVRLMNELWTKELVTFEGEFESVTDAGINPLPVQRPIPVWFGGGADVVLRRTAELGAGWMPNSMDTERAKPMVDALRGYVAEAGRDPDGFGLDARLSASRAPQPEWDAFLTGWTELGATHIGVNTMGMGFKTLDEHLTVLKQFKDHVGF